MGIKKEEIISSNNLDIAWSRFLLGDYLIAKAYFSGLENSYDLVLVSINYCGNYTNQYLLEKGEIIKLVPDIDLSKVYEITHGRFLNFVFRENDDSFEHPILGPFQFSKEYVLQLLEEQYGYKPN